MNNPRLRRPVRPAVTRSPEQQSQQPTRSRKVPHVVTIASGKGGVGKTNLSTNLAYQLCLQRRRVLLLDADLGLANVDVILGLSPEYNISHVLSGEKNLADILVTGPAGMKILPASSGVQGVTQLDESQKIRFLEELERLQEEFDFLLIDSGAGIADNVLYFALAAQTRLVVVTPEPTSLTDAYALIKVLALNHNQHRFHILVNDVTDEQEAIKVFSNLLAVTDKFLNVSLDFIGHVVHDKTIREAVRLQRLLGEGFPDAPASRCIRTIARSMAEMPHDVMAGDLGLLWRNILSDAPVL